MSSTTVEETMFVSSLKSLDTEEKVDLLIFRPLGLKIALFAKKVGIKPNPITFASIISGVIAGHLFYYNDIYINLIGVLFLSLGSTLDSADGQLARMTNQCSQFGRILDGVGGYLWFVSIYLHLILRFFPASNNPLMLIALIGAVAGHTFQSGIADYYRNAHLFFVYGKGEMESAVLLKENYRENKSSMSLFSRIFAIFYINYTVQQEFLTKNLQKLKSVIAKNPSILANEHFKTEYRKFSKPLQKYCNGLTLNSRFFAIYLSLFLNNIYVYFCYELFVLNIIAIYLITEHEYKCKKLMNDIKIV